MRNVGCPVVVRKISTKSIHRNDYSETCWRRQLAGDDLLLVYLYAGPIRLDLPTSATCRLHTVKRRTAKDLRPTL